jgi:hypothetical protein
MEAGFKNLSAISLVPTLKMDRPGHNLENVSRALDQVKGNIPSSGRIAGDRFPPR